MNENTQRTFERTLSPGGGNDLFADNDLTLPVTVSSGPYVEQLPVANMTAGEIRRRFASRFDIDPRAQAILDGNPVGDDTLVRAGQALMFTRPAGEKGRS